MTKRELEIARTAVVRFAAWLTTRKGTLKVGNTHPVYRVVGVTGQFIEALPEVLQDLEIKEPQPETPAGLEFLNDSNVALIEQAGMTKDEAENL